MKKIFTTLMLTLVVMAGMAEITPVELKEYKKSTHNCAYFDFWYFGFSENAQLGYAIFDANGKEVAFTVMSTSETDMCAYYDGILFPQGQYEDRDDEAHYYMSTYWILNSPNGCRFGGTNNDSEVIAKSIVEISNDDASMYALAAGTYYLQIREVQFSYDEYSGAVTGVSIGSSYAQVKFTITDVVVLDLKAEVAADKKTATISWTKPSLPASAHHLYMSVQSGSEIAYDNIAKKESPANPLVVNVKEGRTYSVTAQYVNIRNEAVGSEVKIYFTVGTNQYIPTNLKATVVSDDNVEFTWSAAQKADYYTVVVFKNGVEYATYVTAEQKLNKTLPTGKYTWEVAAFEKEDNDLFYPLTEYVKGNAFETTTAPLPEGTEELNVWAMEAFYMKDYASGGKYPWLVTLETGTSGGTGLPEVWIIVWSDREYGISGKYSSSAGNIEISATAGDGSLINTNGQKEGLITANSVEFTLEFDGFDQDYINYGYYIPYYSGSFLMKCANGKTYHGTMNQFICGTYDYSEIMTAAGSRTLLYSMYDEDSEWQGVETVSDERLEVSGKRIENGQVVIIREGVKYNVLGGRIQ